MRDYEKIIDDLRNSDEYSADHRLIGVCLRAAAAIEALQAQLPKRGEWKRDEKRWGENSIRCSLCGAVIEDEEWGWRNWNYCYHCGAKMEETDADRLD